MPDTQTDYDLIQGGWDVVEVTGLLGEDAEDAKRSRYWFCGDRLITGDSDAAWEWPFRLEDLTTPKKLVTWPEDERFSYSPKALYEFDGDELLLCYNPRENDMPSSFEAGPDAGYVTLRLARSQQPVPQ